LLRLRLWLVLIRLLHQRGHVQKRRE
jgi:hypothetical protein